MLYLSVAIFFKRKWNYMPHFYSTLHIIIKFFIKFYSIVINMLKIKRILLHSSFFELGHLPLTSFMQISCLHSDDFW